MHLKQLNMDGSNRKRIIFLNPTLMITGTLYVLGCLLLCTLMIWGVEKGYIPVANNGEVGVQLIWGILGLGMVISGVLASKKWYAMCYIMGDKVKIIIPFKKSVTRQLCEYKHIYLASYLNRGIYYYYIVYSTVIIHKSLLSKINEIPISADILKIRISRNEYLNYMGNSK